MTPADAITIAISLVAILISLPAVFLSLYVLVLVKSRDISDGLSAAESQSKTDLIAIDELSPSTRSARGMYDFDLDGEDYDPAEELGI